MSDQGLHCLQIFQPFFTKPDVPKIEIRISQNIVWKSSFSLQWVNHKQNDPDRVQRKQIYNLFIYLFIVRACDKSSPQRRAFMVRPVCIGINWTMQTMKHKVRMVILHENVF